MIVTKKLLKERGKKVYTSSGYILTLDIDDETKAKIDKERETEELLRKYIDYHNKHNNQVQTSNRQSQDSLSENRMTINYDFKKRRY